MIAIACSTMASWSEPLATLEAMSTPTGLQDACIEVLDGILLVGTLCLYTLQLQHLGYAAARPIAER
jgi:hypothetical protein